MAVLVQQCIDSYSLIVIAKEWDVHGLKQSWLQRINATFVDFKLLNWLLIKNFLCNAISRTTTTTFVNLTILHQLLIKNLKFFVKSWCKIVKSTNVATTCKTFVHVVVFCTDFDNSKKNRWNNAHSVYIHIIYTYTICI